MKPEDPLEVKILHKMRASSRSVDKIVYGKILVPDCNILEQEKSVSAIFEQTQVETKKKQFMKKFSHPPETIKNSNCICKYNEICLQHKQNRGVTTKQ